MRSGFGSVTVLTVHGVGDTVRTLGPAEDRTWVRVDQFEQVLDEVVGRADVRITFDDGNVSDVEIALPRLLERGMTADFFLLAGELGGRGRVDRAGVRELVSAGMTVGSHGWGHVDWRRLDDETAQHEIDGAVRHLRALSGQPVDRVAIPFGSYDRIVLRRLRKAGFARVYTSDGGRARHDSWLQARNSLPWDVVPSWATRVIDARSCSPRGNAARAVKRWRGSPGSR